jgi:two-component system chemotaxis response regulator CheY
MNALIVDDSRAIYAMVSQMLQEEGHNTFWAEDGLKAVEVLKQNKDIHIVLLDWNMPNMNGPDFLEKNLKEKLTTSPIIMMTTENSPEKIQLAIKLGAAEYIMKPFTKDILINKMSMV